MRQLKVGVIGCGAIGKGHIARLANRIPNAEVVAVSDYFQAAAEEQAKIYDAKVFATGEELIASDLVEAVLISSADPSHSGYVLECIKHGKRVLCEKPLAVTAAECEQIIEAEVAAGKRLVQVGFMRRYDKGYVEMKETLDSGVLGTPLMITACHRNVWQPETFQTDMAITGVVIHELDISRWLLNAEYKNVQILTVRQNTLTNGNYLNPQLAMMETTDGARIVVEIQSSAAYAYEIHCEVVAEKGVTNLPDPPRAQVRTNAMVNRPLMTDWSQRFIEAYEIELQAWVNAVLEDRPEGPGAWDGYAACVAADALIRSRVTGVPEEVHMMDKPALYN